PRPRRPPEQGRATGEVEQSPGWVGHGAGATPRQRCEVLLARGRRRQVPEAVRREDPGDEGAEVDTTSRSHGSGRYRRPLASQSGGARASADPAWITAADRESCHHVWFELHEDLIATLGLSR